MPVRPFLPLVLTAIAVGLAGCGGSDPAPGASTQVDADNPREPMARAELTLVPKAAPPTTPAPAASYTPWPGFGHDAAHTGSAPVRGPQSGAVRWTRALEGAVVPGPAIAKDGTVYAASNGGVLHALDPATGKDRWRYDGGGAYGSDLSTVPLVLPSGVILWPGPGRILFALGPEGRERWRVAFDATVLSPALGPDGTVYVSDMAGGLRALDVSGAAPRTRWELSLGEGTSYSSATVAPDGTVYGAVDEQLVAVRDGRSRGVVRWRFAARSIIEVSPAIGPDGTVVLGTNDAFQYGIGPDGKERWRTPRNALTYSSAAVTAAGVAYYGDHRGALNVVDARSGEPLARHVGLARTKARGDVGVWTAPAIDREGSVYFGTRVGRVYGFSATGRKLLDVDTGATVDSNPVLGADGTLYIGSESGRLYALGR